MGLPKAGKRVSSTHIEGRKEGEVHPSHKEKRENVSVLKGEEGRDPLNMRFPAAVRWHGKRKRARNSIAFKMREKERQTHPESFAERGTQKLGPVCTRECVKGATTPKNRNNKEPNLDRATAGESEDLGLRDPRRSKSNNRHCPEIPKEKGRCSAHLERVPSLNELVGDWVCAVAGRDHRNHNRKEIDEDCQQSEEEGEARGKKRCSCALQKDSP